MNIDEIEKAAKAQCYNCFEPLSECDCGDTQTYEQDDGVICPYCGYLNEACDSDGMLYREDGDDYDCGECGKEFSFTVDLSFSWSGRRKD